MLMFWVMIWAPNSPPYVTVYVDMKHFSGSSDSTFTSTNHLFALLLTVLLFLSLWGAWLLITTVPSKESWERWDFKHVSYFTNHYATMLLYGYSNWDPVAMLLWMAAVFCNFQVCEKMKIPEKWPENDWIWISDVVGKVWVNSKQFRESVTSDWKELAGSRKHVWLSSDRFDGTVYWKFESFASPDVSCDLLLVYYA